MMSACSSSSCATPHSLALLLLLVQQLSIEMGSLEVSELGRHVTSSFSGVKVVEELWGSGSAALRCASRLPARFVRRSVMQLVLDMQPHPHVPQYKEASILFKVGGAGRGEPVGMVIGNSPCAVAIHQASKLDATINLEFGLAVSQLAELCQHSIAAENALRERQRAALALELAGNEAQGDGSLEGKQRSKPSGGTKAQVSRGVAVCVLVQCGRTGLIPEPTTATKQIDAMIEGVTLTVAHCHNPLLVVSMEDISVSRNTASAVVAPGSGNGAPGRRWGSCSCKGTN